MDTQHLLQGLSELETQSRKQYNLSLQQLVSQSGTPLSEILLMGNLVNTLQSGNSDWNSSIAQSIPVPSLPLPSIGIVDLDPGTSVAPRSDHEMGSYSFQRNDKPLASPENNRPPTLNHRRSYFECLAASCRQYLCGNKELQARIREQVDAAKKQGLDVANVTPETLTSAASASLASLLVQAIPALAGVGGAVIAALLVIIYRVGVNAFCAWSCQFALAE